jgi:hypothetical protein
MTSRPTALERAFSLARSGDYSGVSEIRAQLKAEGYSLLQMEGPSLQRQLREICIEAKRTAES